MFLDNYEASSGFLLWQAEWNHLPIFSRPYPLRSLFSEAARYKEFNDRRHKSPHTCKNKRQTKKFSFLTNLYRCVAPPSYSTTDMTSALTSARSDSCFGTRDRWSGGEIFPLSRQICSLSSRNPSAAQKAMTHLAQNKECYGPCSSGRQNNAL